MRQRNQKLDRELADAGALVRAWYCWHRELCDAAVAGPSGGLVEQLLEILQGLELQDGTAGLIAFVSSQNWHAVDADTRSVCLYAIDGRLTALREKAGMPAFDDPLPDQRPNVFITIKNLLFPASAGAASEPIPISVS